MKKILIIRCGALGDLVYASSVIDALKSYYGDKTIIDFVCTPGSGTLFKNDKRINQVFNLKHKKLPIFFSKEKKNIINYSKNTPYNLLINFEYGQQFKSLIYKINAKEKIGALFNDIVIDEYTNRGEAQKLFLKSKIPQNILNNSFPSVFTQNFTQLKSKFNLNEKYIVLSPSNSHVNRSGINYRAWPNTSWKELINILSKKIQVVIVGTSNEEKFFNKIKPFAANTLDLVGKNNIEELCTIIKYSKAVVCTDSAVGHIGAAVNTPVFVLMGPNNIITDSPYQSPTNKVNVISLQLDCSPCYKTKVMKNCKDNICMKNISSEYVYNKIIEDEII